MSALNAPRNTREIFCGGSGYSRKLEIAAGYTLYPGAIAALTPEGKVVPASDNAGLIVAGICEAVFNGYAYLRSGTFLLEAGSGKEALSIQNIGSYVYIIDDQTVGKKGGVNSIVAGVLLDLADGQAVVSVGNHPAGDFTIVKKAAADPDAAENMPAGTLLLVTSAWTGGVSIAEASPGEVYLNNGIRWVKIG